MRRKKICKEKKNLIHNYFLKEYGDNNKNKCLSSYYTRGIILD